MVEGVKGGSIFRTKIDGEADLRGNGIDRRAAADGADVISRFGLGREREAVKRIDDGGGCGDGIGVSKAHPAVAARRLYGDLIAPGADGRGGEGVEGAVDGDDFRNAAGPVGHDLTDALEVAQAFFADVKGEEDTLRRCQL